MRDPVFDRWATCNISAGHDPVGGDDGVLSHPETEFSVPANAIDPAIEDTRRRCWCSSFVDGLAAQARPPAATRQPKPARRGSAGLSGSGVGLSGSGSARCSCESSARRTTTASVSGRWVPSASSTSEDRTREGHAMDIPSPDRITVELQKAVTGAHRLLLESPLGPLLSRTPIGRFLVLHTTGRRSGRPRNTPLSYTKDGDAYVVIASNGGSPGDPDWYLNLQANPSAEVEVSGRRSRVAAETVTGEERERLWRQAVRSYGGYAGYQQRTDRQIPVVRL